MYFLCGTRTIISLDFQPNSEDVVRPRTREEYEYQKQKNNKPARYEALKCINFQPVKKQKLSHLIFFLLFLKTHSACFRPPQPRTHDYENVNPGYVYPDHQAAPRAPTRPDPAYRGTSVIIPNKVN